MIKLRAHHFLCMQGFQGYGYNDEFTENMDKIIKYIHKNKDLEVKIIDGCDDVCEKCINNINGSCKDSLEVANMDNKVIEEIQLKSGEIYKAAYVFKTVNEKIGNIQAASKICKDCSWSEKCIWHRKLVKK